MRLTVYSSMSMALFGRRVASVLDVPLVVDGPVPDCEKVYIVGMYDPPTYHQTLENTKRARERIIHWCGSDVTALTRPEMLPEAVHLCESDNLREELEDKGVEARTATFPTAVRFPVEPLPDEPTVAVYLGSNPAFYGGTVVTMLQDVFPDVRWLTYQYGTYEPEQMPAVVASASVYLRLTPHDGSANTAREFLEGGRRVVGTCDLPYVDKVKIHDLDQIVRKLRRALKEEEPYWEAAAYYHMFNSVERYFADLEGVV